MHDGTIWRTVLWQPPGVQLLQKQAAQLTGNMYLPPRATMVVLAATCKRWGSDLTLQVGSVWCRHTWGQRARAGLSQNCSAQQQAAVKPQLLSFVQPV